MKPNEVNKMAGLQRLPYELQTIAGEIAEFRTRTTPRKYQLLSKKLDHVSKKLDDVSVTLNKTATLFAKSCMENLKEQVVQQYGDLENARVDGEVSLIKEKSTQLRKGLSEGRISLGLMKELEMQINELKKKYLPSAAHLRIIADAQQAFLEAKARLEGKPIIRHFEVLASQKNVRFVEEILPGQVEELLDIARAVYNRDFSQAKRRYATLPSDHKRRFEKHMQNLMAKPFVDVLETMQGMIATVNELVENGKGYPSSNEIDQFFIGLSQVNAEEPAEGKIFSLPPRASSGG